MKLTREQRKALAEKMADDAQAEVKKKNKELKSTAKPKLTEEDEEMAKQALQQWNAIPKVFRTYFNNHDYELKDFKEALLDSKPYPPEYRALSEKTIYNKICLLDLSKFNSIEEVEKSIQTVLEVKY